MRDIKENLSYQTIYQVINILIPLITTPYVSRVLGTYGLGIFSYTLSIVSIFTLFAMLGFINYGTRTIAECGKDIIKRSDYFWNIYFLQFIMSIVALVMYFLYLSIFNVNNMIISFFQVLYIFATLFDISWLFFGIEDFKTTIRINILIRVLSVILIFTFVNSTKDLWLYCLIMSGSIFFSNLLLWFFIKNIVCISYIKKINKTKIISHIKPTLILFIPILAMSAYHIMDKTMLGILSNFNQSGLYYNADKIINLPLGIISGIQTVMLPRVTSIVSNGDNEKSNKILKLSIELITVLTTAMAFGVSAISPIFVPIFFGADFKGSIPLIITLSPVFIIKGFSFTARMQYLIPNHKENIFIKSVFFGAFINLVINVLLIPKYQAMGAVIGTLIAELSACIWQYYYMSKEMEILDTIIDSLKYSIFGLFMAVAVYYTGNLFNMHVVGLIFQILIGALIYSFACIFYRKYQNKTLLNFILGK